MKIGFIIDPIETLNIDMDTSLLMISESNIRGHRVYYCTLDDITLEGSRPFAKWTRINYIAGKTGINDCHGEKNKFSMDELDVIVMRKDPPFDQAYLEATHILDYTKAKVVNSPRGLRDANEKMFALRWPELTPRTKITRDKEEILSFFKENKGKHVIKPLNLCGGSMVFLTRGDDPNLEIIARTATQNYKNYIAIQEFIEDVFKGDKRIFLVNGVPIGQMNRLPPRGDFRANIHLGGIPEPCSLSERDKEIIEKISPALSKLGICHACLDIIGDYLTEVNVTSPSGIPEINRVTGKKHEIMLVDSLEELLEK